MQYTAEAKNIKVSPRKMRLVVDGVKTLPIASALAVLNTTSKRAGGPVKKVLESAIANAINNGQEARDNLVISEMYVNEGLAYKRYHFAARGRIRPYKKRTSHVKVVLGVKEVSKTATMKEEVKKLEEPKVEKKGKEEANK